MRYPNIYEAIFLRRPNRFIAQVLLNGREETVHVKNTGRCRELLVPGAQVYLVRSENLERKTAYDLVAARKGERLINMDSQSPNHILAEYLPHSGLFQDPIQVTPEFTHGDSRFDFLVEEGGRRHLIEVKGVTLEQDGLAKFPDAPTERGVKHLRELAKAVKDGYRAAIAFAIQMDGITEVRPNIQTHAEFGTAMQEAREAGVEILFLSCHVEPDGLMVK